MDADSAERSDHPKSIKKVHKIVLEDQKLKLREVADTLKISEGMFINICA